MNLFKYLNKSINVILGGLVDYESIFSTKQFFNKLGSDIFFESNIKYFNSDFLNDIYTFLNLEDIKILLTISLNLRLEMPILNSKLLRKKDKILFFSIGNNGYFYSNYFKILGNNVFDVLNFIYGKTFLNVQLHDNRLFNMNIFNNYSKPYSLQILIGQSFYFVKNSFYLYNKIKEYILKHFNYSSCFNLFSNVGILNYLNISHLKHFVFNGNSSFYFLSNVDNYYFLKNLDIKHNIDNFIVYRGSFFDEGVKRSDLVFPSSTFFEENYNYKNFSGLNLFTRKVVSNNFYNNKEFFFFLNTLKYKIFKSNLFSIVNFKLLLKYFKFLYIDFNYKIFSNLKLNLKLNNIVFKFLIENKIFNSLIINYYKTDVYSRNSRNLTISSLEYLKTILTYNK
jgi:hypothetical protein